ncbi:AraC family transcriptional regulator [Flammeovirgaceae bacterium SG7u.111]|nr:AraC family transcriptional regulator [Flammeovirgaceae bacterium SG7u.132]WPO37971.1 AraC family transcriptional regulator [Flammeovirgaceae bacterium SG7u.111]
MIAGSEISVKQHLIFAKPDKLVEYRNSFLLDHAELNMYETQEVAQDFLLKFNNPVVVSMIRGKKIMHLKGGKSFGFNPGETVVLPPGELMKIDFPEAKPNDPTRCMALNISKEFIEDTLNLLNEKYPKIENWDNWRWSENNFHLLNSPTIANTLSRLIQLFTENRYAKDVLAMHITQELVIQLLQTKARYLLIDKPSTALKNNHRLAYVVDYIRQNLTSQLRIEDLAEKACLSRPQFFRVFHREFGISPIVFINQERLKLAKTLMRNPKKSIGDICYLTGFNNLNYFSRFFKKMENMSPSEFRKKVLAN